MTKAKFEELVDACKKNWGIECNKQDGLSRDEFDAITLEWTKAVGYSEQEIREVLALVV